MRRVLPAFAVVCAVAAPLAAARPYPILFVTQTPNPTGFGSVAEVFGNHNSGVWAAPRGGDLYILYPDDTLRNLTAAAGYGVATGFQGATAIAVREPSVHWSGGKALFSMIVGAPAQQYAIPTFYWQIYEISGLGKNDTPVITKVANQPADANNVSPVYLSDDRILFTSDRPFNGAAHLYPQRDEYESAPTVSGLWVLDPSTGALEILDHAPSGDFKPIVDSFGRVVFTRWDHLQRDQQADADCKSLASGSGSVYATYDWTSEAANATAVDQRVEVFPEPREANACQPLQAWENRHTINQFFPWMMNQDGTGLETLNHIGRHELLSYFEYSRIDDPNLDIFSCGQNACGRYNPNDLSAFLQIREAPTAAGTYYGVDAPEFGTHASGRVVAMPGEPTRLGDEMAVTYVTHPATGSFSDTPPACHSGLYREPLPLSDGSLVVVHAGERSPGVPETRDDRNDGTTAAPLSRYKFRLRGVTPTTGGCAGYVQYGATLTAGIRKTLWFWSPDVRVDYVDVTMWELDPVEVRPRTAPAPTTEAVPSIEAGIFAQEGVSIASMQSYLKQNRLALIVARNVTTRDSADRQQPYNLRVPGGVQTIGAAGTIYDVAFLQMFQGDLIRGIGGQYSPPSPGRRVLARAMHDPAVVNPPLAAGSPAGAVKVAADGSIAAFVPAHRAMTWQLTSPTGAPVVRERYWLTLEAGEIRVCTSCHGLNSADQAGQSAPVNAPQALHLLLQSWKGGSPPPPPPSNAIFADGFEGGTTGKWSVAKP
jgi:hypothetical protein